MHRLLLVLAVACLFAPPALAQPAAPSPASRPAVRLVEPEVIPVDLDGQPIGCALGFFLERPAAGGRTEEVGATVNLLTAKDSWFVVVKIGYEPAPRRRQRPAEAALGDERLNNASDQDGARMDFDNDYAGFRFAAGPATRRVLATLSSTGILPLFIRTAADAQPQVWTVDLSGEAAIRSQWEACLRRFPALQSGILD